MLATRTLESRTDRMLTMVVLPLMSCSARLPVYVLVIATVFGPATRVFGVVSAGAVALFAMYLLSVTAALTAAAVLRRTVFRGPRPTLMLELPPYRRPVMRVLLRGTWQQVRSFLVDAGTMILALTIILWALLSYPPIATPRGRSFAAERSRLDDLAVGRHSRALSLETLAAQERGEQLRHSVAGRLGHVIEPLSRRWGSTGGSASASSARSPPARSSSRRWASCSTSTMPTRQSQPLRDALRSASEPTDRMLMTPLTGMSLMVFFVLACQCMSTLAVVRRESGSWTWPLFMFGYQTVLAYTAAFLVYPGRDARSGSPEGSYGLAERGCGVRRRRRRVFSRPPDVRRPAPAHAAGADVRAALLHQEADGHRLPLRRRGNYGPPEGGHYTDPARRPSPRRARLQVAQSV